MTVIILWLGFFTCTAPELSAKARADMRERVTSEMKRSAHEAEFNRFSVHVFTRESPDWTAINRLGCMGGFQFAPATLRFFGYGYITPSSFRKHPEIFSKELQAKLFSMYVTYNASELLYFMRYVGNTINGVRITKSGILAGSHLGGTLGVKLYLLSNGKINKRDVNGTSIQDYIMEFQGYDI